MKSVVILGGGLAGLAAAAALAVRGFRVCIFESRNRLGGRASSFTDPVTGQLIDACQHVTMGCCTNFAHFCATTGVAHLLAPQPTLWFMTPDRRVSPFSADRLPAPFHFARSLLRAHYLTLGDKIRIGWGMLALLRTDANDDQPLLLWLKRNRQNQRTIERFWSVVLVSALNETIDRLGLKYARKVFLDGFLRHRRGFEVFLPTVPLARLYGEEMQSWFTEHGVTIETGTAATALEIAGNEVRGVKMRDGRVVKADWYIAALPYQRLLGLLDEATINAHPCFSRLLNFETSPITSVHLWLDRAVLDRPHLVLVDCLGQWIFNRGQSADGSYYLQVVISASHHLKGLEHQEIREKIVRELSQLFPALTAATVLRAKVVTEHAATFSALPGIDRWRPTQEAPLGNLLLAGDWTNTGWPATMEGAVRSGYLTVEAILRRSGSVEQIVQPNL
ncbi:MAG: hydroxysqualene dehydroxylase HpnE [Planctomycetes bacterium]|nr:hydroxysqualene dehydroxylase HpnE [Planctomycetota bacterium]